MLPVGSTFSGYDTPAGQKLHSAIVGAWVGPAMRVALGLSVVLYVVGE